MNELQEKLDKLQTDNLKLVKVLKEIAALEEDPASQNNVYALLKCTSKAKHVLKELDYLN